MVAYRSWALRWELRIGFHESIWNSDLFQRERWLALGWLFAAALCLWFWLSVAIKHVNHRGILFGDLSWLLTAIEFWRHHLGQDLRMSSPEAAHITDLLLALISDVCLYLLRSISVFLLEVFFHKALILGGSWKFSQWHLVDIGWLLNLAEIYATTFSGRIHHDIWA